MAKQERERHKKFRVQPFPEFVYDTPHASHDIKKKADLVIEKYSGLTEQYPQVKIHISAAERLFNKRFRNMELEDEEREALLMYSVWSQDPVAAVEIAQRAGLSEKKLYQYVDLAISGMEPISNAMLGMVEELKQKMTDGTLSPPFTQPVQTPSQSVEFPLVPEKSVQVETPLHIPDIIAKQGKTEPPSSAIKPNPQFHIDRNVLYKDTDKAPARGTLVQSYDHPVLNGGQERILFGYLKSGASIEEVRKNTGFADSFDPEDRVKIIRILDQSATVEEVITSCYLRLVDVIARSYREIPLQDSINSGNIGLIQAARRWEPGEKGRFSTYAVWGIRSAVSQEAYKNRSSIRIPSYVQNDMSKAKWVTDGFQAVFGRSPTNEELRKQLLVNTDMPRWRVNTVIRVIESKIQHVGSIHEKMSEDSEDEKADFIADTTTDVEVEAVNRIADEELRRETRRALKEHLSTEEQHVIKALYGLDGFGEKTSEEVAREMQTTPEFVIDIERRSLAKLRYDRWLRERWAEEPPSFIYGRSAESAAFKLGLFDSDTFDQTKATLPQSPNQEAETPSIPQEIPEIKIVPEAKEIILFERRIDQSLPKSQKITSTESVRENDSSEISADLQLKNDTHLINQSKDTELNLDKRQISIRARIKELRNKDYSYSEIAKALNISKASVGYHVRKIKSEKQQESTIVLTQEQAQHENENTIHGEGTVIARVKQLRNEGYDNQQIAELLGKSYGSVAQAVVRLIRAGEITPHKPFGHDRNINKEVSRAKEVWSKIKELRTQGFSRKAIGKTLGISKSAVDYAIAKLQENGEIVRIPGTSQSSRDYNEDIAKLRSRGLSNSEIARELNISKSTVSDYVSKLVQVGEIEFRLRVANDYEEITNAKTEETELVKKYLEAHPRPTYKDGFRRIFEGRQRRQTGRKPESAERDSQVLALLKQGFTRKKIAERLCVPVSTIDSSVYRMIQLGEYAAGTNASSTKVARASHYTENKKRIVELLEQGLDVVQIAEATEDELRHVQQIVWRLKREGEINPATEQLRSARRTGYIDKNSHIPAGNLVKVYEQVAEMRKQGITNGDIAKNLDLPKHRIEVYASDLIRAGVIKPYK